MDDLTDLADQFIVSRSYRPRSAVQRRTLLRRLLRHLPAEPAAVTPAHLVAWWQSLSHLAPATRRAHHCAAATFLAWVRACGHPCPDVATLIRRPTVPRPRPQTLTATEVDTLRRTPLPWGHRLCVTLMLDLGLRVGDVAGVRGEDVDHDAATITVRGKGGHVDVLPCPSAVLAMVPAHTAGPVAPTTPETVSRWVSESLALAGISGRTPHALRRTFATMAVERGASMRDVQALLRHRSIATSDHYLGAPSWDRLRLAVA